MLILGADTMLRAHWECTKTPQYAINISKVASTYVSSPMSVSNIRQQHRCSRTATTIALIRLEQALMQMDSAQIDVDVGDIRCLEMILMTSLTCWWLTSLCCSLSPISPIPLSMRTIYKERHQHPVTKIPSPTSRHQHNDVVTNMLFCHLCSPFGRSGWG